jgi:hypothetical protein
MDIEKEKGTIGTTEVLVRVDSSEEAGRLERVLDKTMRTCPVGRLFEEAGVDVQASLAKVPLASNGTG